MNKIISTNEGTFFVSLIGPSGSGKSHVFFDWLTIGTFKPAFDKFFYFIKIINLSIVKCKEENLDFIQGVEFNLIKNLANNGTKYLLIIDDSWEISNSKQFVEIAPAGRHRGLNTKLIKHNLFHQSKLGRDVELQNTHSLVQVKSPRDVLKTNTLSR